MYRLFLLLLLTACASQSQTDPKLLYLQRWQASESQATAWFVLQADGRVQGNDGCNRLFGKVSVNQRLDFGQVASTKMACQHQNDRLFWEAVQKHDRWRIRNDELQLLQGNKVLFRFQKVAQAADEVNAEAEE